MGFTLVGSSLACKYETRVIRTDGGNTLDYFNTALITIVKSFTVTGPIQSIIYSRLVLTSGE